MMDLRRVNGEVKRDWFKVGRGELRLAQGGGGEL